MGFYKNLLIEISDFYQEQLFKELERLPFPLDDFLCYSQSDDLSCDSSSDDIINEEEVK